MSDNPLLKTPGEMISEAREAQELTIAQLSERTKIPPPVLTALEMDEYHKISGPLYIKSFLRTCALDLGLDPQVVMSLYNKISGEKGAGSGGTEMVWDEDEVKVSRVGLPWPMIIMAVGVVVILIGVGLFALRGCGDEGPSRAEDSTVPDETAAAESTGMVVNIDDELPVEPRHESLIPPQTENDLRQRVAVAAEDTTRFLYLGTAAASVRDDTLGPGWLLRPPPPVEESPEEAAVEMVSTDPGAAVGEPEVAGRQEAPVDTMPEVVVPDETPVESEPGLVVSDEPQADSEPEVVVASDVADDSEEEVPPASAAEKLEVEPEETPEITVVGAQVDSAWPLVLRIVCDSPQDIRVKRDGDREFSEVRWPAGSAEAPAVPEAGFEAGRAYRQDNRLVVFWGAEDHFSLKLARVRGVEVSINGLVRDVSRLRPGQELILDAHFAGSTPNR